MGLLKRGVIRSPPHQCVEGEGLEGSSRRDVNPWKGADSSVSGGWQQQYVGLLLVLVRSRREALLLPRPLWCRYLPDVSPVVAAATPSAVVVVILLFLSLLPFPPPPRPQSCNHSGGDMLHLHIRGGAFSEGRLKQMVGGIPGSSPRQPLFHILNNEWGEQG